MKINIIIGTVALMVISSCADFLDLKPENEVTYSNAMETPTDMESVLTSTQAALNGTLTRMNMQEYAGAYANGANQNAGMIGKNGVSHLWYSSMMDHGYWGGYYTTIGLANIVEANVKSDWSEEHRSYFIGQARFIKAMCYYDLARHWGQAPIVPDSDNSAPPVGSSTTLQLVDKAISEGLSAFEVLNRFEDLKYADGNKMNNRQYANKEIAATLLAYVYAWKASVEPTITDAQRKECWLESEKYASMVIDGNLSGYAKLEPSILSLQENTLNSRYGMEAIFELDYNPIYTKFMDTAPFYMAAELFGYPYKLGATEGDQLNYSVSCKRVIDLYGIDSNDQRLAQYFDINHYDPEIAIEWPDTPPTIVTYEPFPGWIVTQIVGGYPDKAPNNAYVKKFNKQFIAKPDAIEQERFYNLNCNKIIWRLGDLILLRAEVRNFAGNTSGATIDLNIIRSRAGVVSYPSAKDTEGLQKAIFREREKELIYENHRFFDIMRNKGYYKTELPANMRKLTEQEVLDGALYLPEARDAFENNSKLLPNKYWFSRRN